MSRLILLAALGLCVLLGAVLGFYNAAPVRFDYLFGEVTWPLIALLALGFALGVMASAFLLGWRIVGLRLHQRRLQRQLEHMETELRNLRNLPIASDNRPAD